MTIFGRIKHSFNRITPFSEADHRNPYSHFYKSVDRKIGQRCVSAKSIQKIDEIIKRVAKNNSVEGARLMIEHQLACVSSVEKRNAVLTDHLRERLEKYRGTAKVNT